MNNDKKWYGLIVCGDLEEVKDFELTPMITDFHYGYSSPTLDYEIVKVNVTIR